MEAACPERVGALRIPLIPTYHFCMLVGEAAQGRGMHACW